MPRLTHYRTPFLTLLIPLSSLSVHSFTLRCPSLHEHSPISFLYLILSVLTLSLPYSLSITFPSSSLPTLILPFEFLPYPLLPCPTFPPSLVPYPSLLALPFLPYTFLPCILLPFSTLSIPFLPYVALSSLFLPTLVPPIT